MYGLKPHPCVTVCVAVDAALSAMKHDTPGRGDALQGGVVVVFRACGSRACGSRARTRDTSPRQKLQS